MPNLKHEGPTPIFEQISDWMREKIQSGEWADNHQLISETDLASQLNVSRGTIRKAIERLVSEKLLVRVHGKGTFVRNSIILEQLPNWRVAGFSNDLINRGIPYSTDVLLKEIIDPPEEIQKILNLTPNEKIFHMHRLRKINEQPVLLIENHIAYHHCKGIEEIDFSSQQLYNTLENSYQINFDWANRSFKSMTADRHIAENLKINKNAAVMFFEELYHDPNDTPIEYTRAWFDGQIFYIKTIIKREDEISNLPRIFQ